MKLRTKIILGFVIVAVLGWMLGVIGLVSTWMLSSLSLEQDDIQASYADAAEVLNAHYEWRHSLTMAVSAGEEFTGSTDATSCALGKWLASDSAQTDDAELLTLIEQVQEPHGYIHEEAKQVNAFILAGDQGAALAHLSENILPRTQETISLIGQIEHRYSAILAEKADEIARVQSTMSTLILSLFGVVVLISVLLAIVIIKSIMKPIRALSKSAGNMALGVLDFEHTYKPQDEIGQLSRAFESLTHAMARQAEVLGALANGDYTVAIEVRSEQDTVNKAVNALIEQTNQALSSVRQTAHQVAGGAAQIASGSQSLASGSTQQAATVEELSASISQVQSQAEANTELANSTVEDTAQAGRLMSESMEYMGEMTQAMTTIEASSQEIAKVIKVIDDIAFQTNILALNAAVEAARAGQHGKGFAVVADEVRNLASKSADAAKETASLIQTSVENVQAGARIAEKTGESLGQVGAIAASNAEAMGRMSEASAQQSAAINEINTAIHQISQVVQANSATAEESAASAQELNAQAAMLDTTVSRFKLRQAGEQPALPPARPAAQAEVATGGDVIF